MKDVAGIGENGRDLEGLSVRQRKTIPHLVAAGSREEGCRRAGIGRSTLSVWLQEPAFRRALRFAEDEAYREALQALQRLTGRAVEVLHDLMDGAEASPVRLRAAVEVVAHALKSRDAVEIEERLAALEARLR